MIIIMLRSSLFIHTRSSRRLQDRMDVKTVLTFSTWLLQLLPQTVLSYSIEKHIADAAERGEVFNMFHVMPDGMMNVMHEMDMLLTLDQYKTLYMDDNDDGNDNNENDDERKKRSSQSRYKRKAIRDIATRWPGCKVYYEIHEILDRSENRAEIRAAMDEWERYTCLYFIQSDTETNRIQFKNGDGCSSAVGMQQGHPQPIHLAGGCRTKGIIAYEIGHAIGWFHEHSRPDRDRYVRMNFNLIPPFSHKDYIKYSEDRVNTYGIPYDYGSIMHYGASTFKGAMVALDPKFQSVMGQQDGLSFKDIKLANVMYDCARVMGCSKKDCGDDGFQLYKGLNGEKACECWCDSGNITHPLVRCGQRETTPKTTTTTTTTLPEIVDTTTLAPTSPEPTGNCMDVRADCEALKAYGLCDRKMTLMMKNCPETCGFCGRGENLCMDYETGCGLMEGRCEEPGLRSVMSKLCMATCNKCPSGPPSMPCDVYNEMMGKHVKDASTSMKMGNGAFNVFLSLGMTILVACIG